MASTARYQARKQRLQNVRAGAAGGKIKPRSTTRAAGSPFSGAGFAKTTPKTSKRAIATPARYTPDRGKKKFRFRGVRPAFGRVLEGPNRRRIS